MRQPRITFRLSPGEMLTLKEIKDKMGVSCSCLVRTIIMDFLTRNEETLDRLLYGENQITTEETEDL